MENEIELEKLLHKGKEQLALKFKYNINTINTIKQALNPVWSNTQKAWLLPCHNNNVNEIINILHHHHIKVVFKQAINETRVSDESSTKPILTASLNNESLSKLNEFINWLKSRRYSENTISTYTDCLKTFLKFFAEKSLAEINHHDVVTFNNQYILAKQLSASYQNQLVNALKLFFNVVQNKSINVELIHRPKREKLLPNVLSKEDVKLILSASNNIKHRAMLSLIYSCGLRCGELLNLKPEHIDSKRGLVIIKQAKGKKDRIVPLSNKILELLREYYKASKPHNWLFEGQLKGKAYDERSLQSVLKQSVSKAGIKKPVTLHWLRHSYATHLLENGTDLRYIQELLGHSSSRTTEIYTHVSNNAIQKIASPFDTL
jgi:integrase/recombinase XerD